MFFLRIPELWRFYVGFGAALLNKHYSKHYFQYILQGMAVASPDHWIRSREPYLPGFT